MDLLKIEPKLVKWIDAKLAGNGFAQQAMKDKLPRLVMCEAAKSMVGIKEKTGNNDGEMIELIQDTVGGPDHWPYCASGVMTCAAYAELKTGMKTKLFISESTFDLWNLTPAAQRVKFIPLPGAVVIWGDVNTKGQWKGTGHTEIVLFADDKSFHCVGFNTSGTVDPKDPVNRNGNGVYYTVRNYKDTKSRRLRGFLKPF